MKLLLTLALLKLPCLSAQDIQITLEKINGIAQPATNFLASVKEPWLGRYMSNLFRGSEAKRVARDTYLAFYLNQVKQLTREQQTQIENAFSDVVYLPAHHVSAVDTSQIKLAVADADKGTALEFLERVTLLQQVIQNTVTNNSTVAAHSIQSLGEVELFAARKNQITRWRWAYVNTLPAKLRHQIKLYLGSDVGQHGAAKTEILKFYFEYGELAWRFFQVEAKLRNIYWDIEATEQYYYSGKKTNHRKSLLKAGLSFCAGALGPSKLFRN